MSFISAVSHLGSACLIRVLFVGFCLSFCIKSSGPENVILPIIFLTYFFFKKKEEKEKQ